MKFYLLAAIVILCFSRARAEEVGKLTCQAQAGSSCEQALAIGWTPRRVGVAFLDPASGGIVLGFADGTQFTPSASCIQNQTCLLAAWTAFSVLAVNQGAFYVHSSDGATIDGYALSK